MANSKVCPLCGTKYSADETLCPADGRLLVEEPGSDVTETVDPVRLSSATEALLGDILDENEVDPAEGEPAPARRRRGVRMRHSSTREERTLIGPPPDMSEHMPRPGEEEREETTVATAVSAPSSEGELPQPLASLGLSSDEAALADDLQGEDTTRHSRDVVERLQSADDADETIRAPARVFEDLQMEASQLAADEVSDDEVTKRVVREEPVDSTRRSEMPPEFAEALRREQEEERKESQRKAGSAADEPSDTVLVDDSLVADDANPEPVGFDLDNEEKDKTQRNLPRPNDLKVARMEMNIGRQDDNDARYFFVGLFVFAAAVAAFLAYVL